MVNIFRYKKSNLTVKTRFLIVVLGLFIELKNKKTIVLQI